MISALRQFKPQDILSAVKPRYAATRNQWFHLRYMEICGSVVGAPAEEWVRQMVRDAKPEVRAEILSAAGKCLPLDETLRMAFASLDSVPERDLPTNALLVLAQFRDTRVWDWLETHVKEQVPSAWGELAAVSGITWDRLAMWLKRGRPLSLVAIDALVAFDTPQALIVQQIAPKLRQHPDESDIRNALMEYARLDPAPRVKRSIEHILASLPSILGSSSSA